MNHNLIIKRAELSDKQGIVRSEIHSLSKFLKEYDTLFIEESSKSALLSMKTYLARQNESLNSMYEEDENLEREIRDNCSHEILYENYDQMNCALCTAWFFPKDVTFSHIFLKGDRQYGVPSEIYRIIIEIAKKEEDPIEAFEDYSYDNPKLEKIKIYKRRMTK